MVSVYDKDEITWIRDAAHNSNDDQPEQVNRGIKEFLLRIAE